MTLQELADIGYVSVKTLRRRIKDGHLRAVRTGGTGRRYDVGTEEALDFLRTEEERRPWLTSGADMRRVGL